MTSKPISRSNELKLPGSENWDLDGSDLAVSFFFVVRAFTTYRHYQSNRWILAW